MAITWLIICVVLFVLLFVTALCKVSGESADVEEKPISEETTLHPQEKYEPDATVVPDKTSTQFIAQFTDEEINMAAKTVWGEARGIESEMEQAAIVWCFLNRYDCNGRFGTTLEEVITAPGQFHYSKSFKTVDDFGRDIKELVRDVIGRWEREKNGQTDVGRVLPNDYLWFGGENGHNWFRNSYDSFDNIWDWTLPNPYMEE